MALTVERDDVRIGPQDDYRTLRSAGADVVRAKIRAGAYQGHTAGLAPGKLQCNLVILPKDEADDFARFCAENPKPCPLMGVSEAGDPIISDLGEDVDLRTDAAGYNLYREGALVEQRADIADLWRDDLVGFALGCSFTFERALIEADVPLRHIAQNKTVPMFRTAIETTPAGPFGGPLVASMRPIRNDRLQLACEISERYPQAHGAPVHIGDPEAIGVGDLNAPDWGDAVIVEPWETPVFWACGVTPQSAAIRARAPFCITHTPGRMLIAESDENAGVKGQRA